MELVQRSSFDLITRGLLHDGVAFMSPMVSLPSPPSPWRVFRAAMLSQTSHFMTL